MELPELGDTVSIVHKGRQQSLTLRLRVLNPDDSVSALVFRDIRNHPVYMKAATYLALAGVEESDDEPTIA